MTFKGDTIRKQHFRSVYSISDFLSSIAGINELLIKLTQAIIGSAIGMHSMLTISMDIPFTGNLENG